MDNSGYNLPIQVSVKGKGLTVTFHLYCEHVGANHVKYRLWR
jgi:hypothetical protein